MTRWLRVNFNRILSHWKCLLLSIHPVHFFVLSVLKNMYCVLYANGQVKYELFLKLEVQMIILLSNYNIKYICTIYTRLDTCLMSISRFSLRDKVTLQLLKLYFNITDVVEWSRALDIRLRDWCCSVSMVWIQIPSREEQIFDSSKI